MEPLPPGGGRALLEELADQFFIPSGEHVDALRDELLAIARDRFGAFTEKVLLNAGAMLLEAIADFIADVLATISQWEKDLLKAIDDLGKALTALAEEITQLIEEMEAAFGKAMDSFEALLETLSNSSMRSALKARSSTSSTPTRKSILKQNPLYKALPREFRSAVKSLLKDTIRGLVNSPIVDPVLDVIGAIAGALDDVVDDVRSLDPDGPWRRAGARAGAEPDRGRGARPLRVDEAAHHRGVPFSYEFFGHHSVSFEVGRVDIPFSTFFGILRDAVKAIGAARRCPHQGRRGPRHRVRQAVRPRGQGGGEGGQAARPATACAASTASTPRPRRRSPC